MIENENQSGQGTPARFTDAKLCQSIISFIAVLFPFCIYKIFENRFFFFILVYAFYFNAKIARKRANDQNLFENKK